jgi:hypothetical protein
MKTRYARGGCALVGTCLCLAASHADAQVECWAPGMSSSVVLNSMNGSRSVSLGKPYRYDVYGVAGSLELGDQARDAIVVSGKFRQKYLIGNGPIVSSTGAITLQTGLLTYYPKQLSVTGNVPATAVGPVLNYGALWTLSDPKNPANVNLTFHQTGSSLLGALLPGLLEPAHANLNPRGSFYVLGEYHAAPPVMTGALTVGTDNVLTGCPVSCTWSVQRDETPVYRPPLLGLILGDSSVTILGTPPATPSGSGGGSSQVAVTIDSNQINVAINLSANEGTGWKKTTVAP